MNELAKPVKGISWCELVEQIAEEDQNLFPKEKAGYIRSLISGRVMFKYPLRRYETDTTTINNVLIVKRLKDVEESERK